jgi:hypothetical protein
VSSEEAWRVLGLATTSQPTDGAIDRLSWEALRYAQALKLSDVTKISARMYFYNRLPVSPEWKHKFSSPGAVARHLGLQPDGTFTGVLERRWRRVAVSPGNEGWRIWRSPNAVRVSDTPTYKLYI